MIAESIKVRLFFGLHDFSSKMINRFSVKQLNVKAKEGQSSCQKPGGV